MYAEMIEHIVKSLVDYPDEVNVRQLSGPPKVKLELTVHDSDMGRVIGKRGRVVNAMRTILRNLAAKQGEEVNLEIV